MSIKVALDRIGVVLTVAVMVACGGGSGGGDGGNSKAEGGSSKSASSGKGGSFTDPRDKQKYRTVKVGGLTWMAENLNFKPEISWCYGDDESNCKKYGRLYDWQSAKAACPSGWRLPTNDDWSKLIEATGDERFAGKRLKSTTGWDDSEGKSGNGTDEFGFSALPGGFRVPDAKQGTDAIQFVKVKKAFQSVYTKPDHKSEPIRQVHKGEYLELVQEGGGWYKVKVDGKEGYLEARAVMYDGEGVWWSATESDGNAYYWYMNSEDDGVFKDDGGKIGGLSVRCVQN